MRIGRRVCELTLVWLEGRKVCKGEQSIYQKTNRRYKKKKREEERKKSRALKDCLQGLFLLLWSLNDS